MIITGSKRNNLNLNSIFSETREGYHPTVPQVGSIKDFVKSEAGNKYKKLYPNTGYNWAKKPEKPVCSVVRMFGSSDVQDVLLQEENDVLFVPVFDSWGYVYVYVKIPDEFVTELENKLLNQYQMRDYLHKFLDSKGIVKANEGAYFRVNGLENGMPDKEDINHVFQHYGYSWCLKSEEALYKHCEWFFNEDYYGGLNRIDRDLRTIFKNWVNQLWNYLNPQDYKYRIIECYQMAYDILQQAYENERIAIEERNRKQQEEHDEKIQSYIDWIEEGNPVYQIYGWRYKGANYNAIDPDTAIEEIKKGRPFEINYLNINGKQCLVLQYVGENDLL